MSQGALGKLENTIWFGGGFFFFLSSVLGRWENQKVVF